MELLLHYLGFELVHLVLAVKFKNPLDEFQHELLPRSYQTQTVSETDRYRNVKTHLRQETEQRKQNVCSALLIACSVNYCQDHPVQTFLYQRKLKSIGDDLSYDSSVSGEWPGGGGTVLPPVEVFRGFEGTFLGFVKFHHPRAGKQELYLGWQIISHFSFHLLALAEK